LALVIALHAGCSPAPDDRLGQVQICLHDAAGLAELRNLLQETAASHQMEFYDRSAEAKGELASLQPTNPAYAKDQPFIMMTTSARNGPRVSASNLGLPGYQAVLGFNGGDHMEQGQSFADGVIEQLRARWSVVEVPKDRGAEPLSDCQAG
jgi:hypothetical protein